MSIRVVIVEDKHLIRNSLVELINCEEDMECVGAYATAETFTDDFSNLNPDVVLMDIKLPGISGIECIRMLKPKKKEVQYVMCTIFEDTNKIFDSLCAGATGYLLKNTPPARLYEAIREVFSGGSPISSQIARKITESYHEQSAPVTNSHEELSAREMEILHLIAKGLRYKEIAEQLFITIQTVKTHVRNIYEKLHVRSRIEAMNKVFPVSTR